MSVAEDLLPDAKRLILSKITIMEELKDITEYIHRDRDIMGGTPVFRGTRVPVQALFDHLNYSSLEQFKKGFPSVTEEQIEAVLYYAEQNLVKNLPLPAHENAA